MELKAGGVDAVINDRPVNDYYIVKNGAQGVKALDERLTAEDYGIAVGKDNKELQEKINAALKKIKENGEYDKIYAKWFGEKKYSYLLHKNTPAFGGWCVFAFLKNIWRRVYLPLAKRKYLRYNV